jgi:urease accessory protein
MRRPILTALAALSATLLALPAAAHHPTGGMMPVGVLEGFLSGLGHPVIGVDHLAFLVAVGLAAGVAGLGATVPLLFVAASLGGVLLHVAEAPVPFADALVAGSVALAGALLLARRGRPGIWATLALAAGLVHGFAYGEAVVGAEATPVLAYLAGLALVQGAMTLALTRLASGWPARATLLAPRLAGTAIIGIGLATLALGVLPGG